MITNIEILAPAGNMENLVGAINAGANAVYLAGKSFGARKYASNFSDEEIIEVIKYAHLRNVKVFVTVNTIVFEDEIAQFIKYTDFLVSYNVDALIVQDLGIIEMLTSRYPTLEIHASTQMNTYNVNQAKYLKSIGVSRIILARETSVNMIREIKQEVDIDIEVFVHGALCVAYSGNCLFSSMNGGRSGNRGECAQPCRLPYTLLQNNTKVGKEEYLLSTKDLMTIDELDKIINSGVTSLKIEGRMRSFEYVTATIRTYKKALDAYLEGFRLNTDNVKKELLAVFNREYTKGYISNINPSSLNNSYRPNHLGVKVGEVISFAKGKTKIKLNDTLSVNDGIRIIGNKDVGGKVNRILISNTKTSVAHKGDIITIDMQQEVSPGDIVRKTRDIALNNELQTYNNQNFKLIPLYLNVKVYTDNPISLSIQTEFSEEITILSEYIVKKAKGIPQTKSQIEEQLSRLGNTHYKVITFDIDLKGNCFIPNSVLKQLRRDAIKKLEEKILSRSKNEINIVNLQLDTIESKAIELICKVENNLQYDVLKELGIKTIYHTSNVTGSSHNYLYANRISSDEISSHNNLVINDFGILPTKKNIVTNEHLNVVNSYSVYSLLSRGVQAVTISQESTLRNTELLINSFKNQYGFTPPLEVIMYSCPDLMITKYCPITKGEGLLKVNCNLCQKNQYYLQDTNGNKYPIIRDTDCNVRILHSKRINKINDLRKYTDIGISRIRLDFTTETPNEVREVILSFQKALKKIKS